MSLYKNTLVWVVLMCMGKISAPITWSDKVLTEYSYWTQHPKPGIKTLLGYASEDKPNVPYIDKSKATQEQKANYRKLVLAAGFINASTSNPDQIKTTNAFEKDGKINILTGFTAELTDDEVIDLINILIMSVRGDYAQAEKYKPLVKIQQIDNGKLVYVIDLAKHGDDYYFVLNSSRAWPNNAIASEKEYKNNRIGYLMASEKRELFLSAYESKGQSSRSRDLYQRTGEYFVLSNDLYGKVEIMLQQADLDAIFGLIDSYEQNNPKTHTVYTQSASRPVRNTFVFDGNTVHMLSANL